MGGAFLLVASLLLCLRTSTAAIQHADYLNHDMQALQKQVEAGVSEPERLLVRSLGVRDTAAVLNMMRCISSHPASPDWVRTEANRVLCDWFCLHRQDDSLRVYEQRLRQHEESYRCDLLPDRADWLVQVGAFSTEANAERALRRLEEHGVATRVSHDGRLYYALAGGFSSKADAKDEATLWRSRGWINDFSIKEAAELVP